MGKKARAGERHTEIGRVGVEDTQAHELLGDLWPGCNKEPDEILAAENRKEAFMLVAFGGVPFLLDSCSHDFLCDPSQYFLAGVKCAADSKKRATHNHLIDIVSRNVTVESQQDFRRLLEFFLPASHQGDSGIRRKIISMEPIIAHFSFKVSLLLNERLGVCLGSIPPEYKWEFENHTDPRH